MFIIEENIRYFNKNAEAMAQEAQLHIANENGLKITLSGISDYRIIKFETMENEVNRQLTA